MHLFWIWIKYVFHKENKRLNKKEDVKMQNPLCIFHQNSFQSTNFAFVHFGLLTFKFIQLRVFHQFFFSLYVVVNFPIF